MRQSVVYLCVLSVSGQDLCGVWYSTPTARYPPGGY